MNLNFLIKKNHIFKRRKKKIFSYEFFQKKIPGIFNRNQIRFEFIYLKVFKKIFRKKFFKKKSHYKLAKFWIMIKPNFILSMKSKNSRMGSGVGMYVRVCSILKPGKPIILLKGYSKLFVLNVIKYIKLKINLNTYLLHK